VIAAWPGPLIVDEAYIEFGADSVVDLLRDKRDLLIVRTLSKAYGLAGLRVGFLLGDRDVLREIGKVRGVYTVDRVAAAAGIAALGDAGYLQRTVAKIAVERRRLIRVFALLGIAAEDNPVNFVWTRPPNAAALAADLGTIGIHVRCFGDALRITVGNRRDVQALLAALRRALVAQADAEVEVDERQ
jgi:histidinol-phosphate aminotransferase